MSVFAGSSALRSPLRSAVALFLLCLLRPSSRAFSSEKSIRTIPFRLLGVFRVGVFSGWAGSVRGGSESVRSAAQPALHRHFCGNPFHLCFLRVGFPGWRLRQLSLIRSISTLACWLLPAVHSAVFLFLLLAFRFSPSGDSLYPSALSSLHPVFSPLFSLPSFLFPLPSFFPRHSLLVLSFFLPSFSLSFRFSFLPPLGCTVFHGPW